MISCFLSRKTFFCDQLLIVPNKLALPFTSKTYFEKSVEDDIKKCINLAAKKKKNTPTYAYEKGLPKIQWNCKKKLYMGFSIFFAFKEIYLYITVFKKIWSLFIHEWHTAESRPSVISFGVYNSMHYIHILYMRKLRFKVKFTLAKWFSKWKQFRI